MNHEDKLERALLNFLSLSTVLDNDLCDLLKHDYKSDSWKRNIIRSSVTLIEGYCHCFKEFCQVALDTGAQLSEKRLKAIVNEGGCSATERIKLTIQSSYDVFEIEQNSGFSCEEWRKAKDAIEKRSKLMHPKTVEDLKYLTQIGKNITKVLHGLSMYHLHLLKKPIKSMANNTANNVINSARKKRARRTTLHRVGYHNVSRPGECM